MKPKEIHGLLEDENGRRSFILSISAPKKSSAGDYFCTVDLPAVDAFGEGVKIYGVDAEQAEQLSLNFVRKMLSGKRIFDKNGRAMKI